MRQFIKCIVAALVLLTAINAFAGAGGGGGPVTVEELALLLDKLEKQVNFQRGVINAQAEQITTLKAEVGANTTWRKQNDEKLDIWWDWYSQHQDVWQQVDQLFAMVNQALNEVETVQAHANMNESNLLAVANTVAIHDAWIDTNGPRVGIMWSWYADNGWKLTTTVNTLADEIAALNATIKPMALKVDEVWVWAFQLMQKVYMTDGYMNNGVLVVDADLLVKYESTFERRVDVLEELMLPSGIEVGEWVDQVNTWIAQQDGTN